MMEQVTQIKFNSKGFEEILTSTGTTGAVTSAAQKIKAQADANGHCSFGIGVRTGKAYGSLRALGFVYTVDRKSDIAESENKALSGAVR